MRRSAYLASGVALLLVGAVHSAPQPGLLPTTWELEFSFVDPQRISVVLPGEQEPTTYWYVLYTVTNRGDREAPFLPTFEIVTDALEVVVGGNDVSPTVHDSIRELHRKVYPFFVDPHEVIGPVRPGEDNARTSAVAFRQLKSEVNAFSLYVGGLSGEMTRVRNSLYDADKPQTKENQPFYVLRKTLAIEYDVPGDRRTRAEVRAVRTKQEWVMR